MNPRLEAALSYARRGWSVHPLYRLLRGVDGAPVGCECGGQTWRDGTAIPNGCADPASRQWAKHPRGAWRARTTRNETEIRGFWKKWPGAGVGIACGPMSDLWVLDVDGDGGRAQLAELEARNGALPVTWRVRTGSGGEQLYFRWPLCGRKPGNKTKMVKATGAPVLGEGLDARGDGGQVVAPPSENRSGSYSLICDADPAYAPGWLLDMVCPPPPAARAPGPAPTVGVTGEGVEKRLRGCLAHVCARVAETTEGGQNALNKACWTIGRHHAAHPGILSDGEIMAALEAAAESCGLPMSGARATIRSTLSKAAAEPVPLADRAAPLKPSKQPRHAPQAPSPVQTAPDAAPPPGGPSVAAQEAPAPPPPAAPEIAGLPDGWVTPDGWILSPHGVWEIIGSGRRQREVMIAVAPIWIADRRRDIETCVISLTIAWAAGQATVKRAAALSHRDLLKLADQGAPVSSSSAAGIVRWLEAAEAANAEALPLTEEATRLGWVPVPSGGSALQGADAPYALRLSENMAQLQSAIQPHGTYAAWLEAAHVVHAASPLAALLLAASVGSVLLARLDSSAAPFVVDIYGTTTQGKTTALRWACSGWAAPQDGAGGMIGWDTSATGIEGRAGVLRHWPLMIDDTKKIRPRDREAVGTLVYNWSAGQGRGRGTVDAHARSVTTWRALLMSTGEQRIADVIGGHHAGAQMRMLPLSGVPFPDKSPAVERIEKLATWGHLPARVGARICEIGDAALRARWTEQRDRLAGAMGGTARGMRLAGMGATVLLGCDILVDLGVPMPVPEIERQILAGLWETHAGADLATESWTRIGAWLASVRDRLSDRPGDSDRMAPAGGWIGRVLGSRIAVMPSAVEGELRRLGFEPGEVVSQWQARGWLVPAADGARTQIVRWCGGRTRLWVLVPDAGIGQPEAGQDDRDEDAADIAH